MNITGASNGGKLRCHDPSLYPCSVRFFHVFRDVLMFNFSSLSAERRTFQRGWPVWGLANENERIIAAPISLISPECAKSCPDALENRWADTYLLVRHLDSPSDRGLSAASHVDSKDHFVLIGDLTTGRSLAKWTRCQLHNCQQRQRGRERG